MGIAVDRRLALRHGAIHELVPVPDGLALVAAER